jgi:predicted DCC family thiol-disulfide oxidoreductase YuxK
MSANDFKSLPANALENNKMKGENGMITVYYDGACPQCIRDRHHYEKLSGRAGKNVYWFDITGQDERLHEIGIDPEKALRELHVSTEDQQILSEIDAYILLMKKVPLLKPVAWLMGLPLIRPMLSKIYRRQVDNRLKQSIRR